MEKTLEYRDGTLWLLDQTLLPTETRVIPCRTVAEVAEAIRSLRVRGAPAIGLAAAYGVVLAAERGENLEAAIAELASTRPTAINLFWALERMRAVAREHGADVSALRQEADRLLAEDERINRAMGANGARLVPDGAGVMTHCNAGALATGAWGTALGVLRSAHEEGKRMHVWVDETRPLLQGARLTAWELQAAGIPCTLITDSMAAVAMRRGDVDLIVVGADRIAANGDTANKVGTYGLAVLAKHHGVPFYVVAPTSTVDLSIPDGVAIPIEERHADEVTSFGGRRVAPEGVAVFSPAFDVTPADLIAAIVTEAGIIRPPFDEGLCDAVAVANPVDHFVNAGGPAARE